jgi:5-methyltetrahydrofolate--homocysteine methyltransferase
VETTLSSSTRTVVVGPGRPVTLIGERINPTGRRRLAEEMAAGELGRVREEALAQVAAGAHMLDVNAGVPMADEPALLARTVELVQALTDVPLCLDSSVVDALAQGLDVYRGKALVNSVTGEEERLEAVLPLVRKHGAAVIGLAMDGSGIPGEPAARLAVARRILERARDHGIPPQDVLIDPLVLPEGAASGSGRRVLETLRLLREELGVNTVCGASNVSFGLPDRARLNGAFLSMMAAAGLTAAIANPLDPESRLALLASDALLGHDEYCMAWIAAHRAAAGARGASAGASDGRGGSLDRATPTAAPRSDDPGARPQATPVPGRA